MNTRISVADLGCLSRILIFTHPGSRISDPNTATKEGVKKKLVACHKFHKIENYFSFEVLKTKIWASFQRIIELFTKKLSLSSQKYGFGIQDPRSEIWDPGSGIRKKPIPDPGSGFRGQKGTGSRIRIRNTDENALIALRGPVGGRGRGGPGWVRGELGGGDDRQSSCTDSAVLGLAVYRALSLLVSMASIVTDGRRGGGLKQCVKLMGCVLAVRLENCYCPEKFSYRTATAPPPPPPLT